MRLRNFEITDLCNHVPVESVEHRLSMLMLPAERGPEGRADGAVDGPGIFSDEYLQFAFAGLL